MGDILRKRKETDQKGFSIGRKKNGSGILWTGRVITRLVGEKVGALGSRRRRINRLGRRA